MKQMVFISFCVKLTLYLLCSMKLLSSFCLKPPYELSWQHVARNYCTDALPYKDSIQCLFLQKKNRILFLPYNPLICFTFQCTYVLIIFERLMQRVRNHNDLATVLFTTYNISKELFTVLSTLFLSLHH